MVAVQAPELEHGQISRASIQEWDSAVGDVHTRLEFRNDSRRRFSGTLSTASFGKLRACSFRGTALTASRVERNIALSEEGTTIMVWQFRGRGRGTQRGIEAELDVGDIIFLDLDTPYEVNCSDDFGQLVVHAPTGALEERLRAHGIRRDLRGASLKSSPQAVPWLCFLGGAFAQAQEAGAETMCSLYLPAMASLASLASLSLGSGSIESNAEVLCSEAIMTIRAEYWRSDFTAEDLARRLHVSRRTLFRVLDETGSSFTSLLQDARLEAAAQMLSQPALTLTIEAIGHTVGYQSVSTFYTRFREKFGLSPGSYRHQCLNNGTHPHTC